MRAFRAFRAFRALPISIFFLFFIFSLFGEDDVKISFKWAFLKQSKSGTIEAVDFSKEVSFTKDDKLKISINPLKSAYVYLYYVDFNNDLFVIFPEKFDADYKTDKTYYIPENEGEWFTFDEGHGLDKFYLLASFSRLKDLENLTKEFMSLSDNKKTSPDKLANAKKALIDEILNLRLSYSKFTVYAEKPTSIAGTSRGISDVKITMLGIEANKFYGKVLRINH
jgi:hypothetical protein